MPGQILPRLFWPAFFVSMAFSVAAWCQPLLYPAAFAQHWFRNTVVLRAVHLWTLGHLGLLFLSVLAQALPVLFRLPKRGGRLDAWVQGLWALGACLIVTYLGGWRAGHILACGLLTLGTAFVLGLGRALTIASARRSNSFAWRGLSAAMLYLALMLLLGGSMAQGLRQPLLPQDPFDSLRLHVHLGLWGFAAMAIFGFLPKLLRLFQGSSGYPAWPLNASFGLIHVALAALTLHWLAWIGPLALLWAGAGLIAASLLFILQLALLLKAAKGRRFDSSLSAQLGGVAFLLPAAALDAWCLVNNATWQQQASALALGIGFISLVLLGTLQRICAVLSWFQRFFAAAMTHAVPTAWDLIHPRWAWSVLPLQASAVIALTTGLWTGQTACLRGAGALGLAAQVATVLVAVGALTLGQATPFPNGENPYEEWVRSQA